MNIICPKYVIKTPKQANRLCFSVFIVNFEQILHITVLFFGYVFTFKKIDTYSEPSQTSKMELFAKIGNGF